MRLTASETMLVNLPSLRRYDLTKKLQAQPATIADMTDEQRREYMRQATRAKQREATAAGEPLPTKETVRDVLADAALMLLAVGGRGAEQIETVPYNVFQTKPGAVLRVIRDVKKGKMRQKLVQP